ncbi:MAG: hypothetical protein U0936_21315 [Planctomycetaceae bacterium]
MKMNIKSFLKIMSAFAIAALSQTVSAQTTDTQRFTVTVPSTLSITGPADQTLTHDTTNNNQVFAPGSNTADHWAVQCNSGAGATVNLRTNTPFTHTSNSTYKRDAKLDLAVSSSDNNGTSAIWTVSTASDQTNYAGSDNVAAVQATSSQPGKARWLSRSHLLPAPIPLCYGVTTRLMWSARLPLDDLSEQAMLRHGFAEQKKDNRARASLLSSRSLALLLLALNITTTGLGQSVEIRAREKAQELTRDLRRSQQHFRVRWDVHGNQRDDGITNHLVDGTFSAQSGKQQFLADAGPEPADPQCCSGSILAGHSTVRFDQHYQRGQIRNSFGHLH